MRDSAELLGPDGPFAALIPGFAARAGQREMALAVEDALAANARLIVECGTGTGKTLAYLVPALLSGRRVIVSTGTRHLQDQIFRRDLPLVRDALALPVEAAMLKGRANYLCRQRLARAAEGGADPWPDTNEALARVALWAARTSSGDIEEMEEVEADSPVWSRVTSTSENCLGTRCPDYERCHVNRARARALKADVVVVNHHLFCADLVLREEGFGQLLPDVDAVIFDEAHQLPETAGSLLATAVSGRQLTDLVRDALAEETQAHSAVALAPAGGALQQAVAELGAQFPQREGRGAMEDLASPAFHRGVELVKQRLADFCGLLEQAAATGPGLERCWQRGAGLADDLEQLTEREHSDRVQWYETTPQSFRLCSTPLEAGSAFWRQVPAGERAWVFTSATLAVGDDFGLFQRALGLEAATTARWESPFDYRRQALLYLPDAMPEPQAGDYIATVVERALPVLDASGGRTFMLFTSHRSLQQARRGLESKCRYPLLVQGDAPRMRLLERFRALGNAVLLGTASFWEGVDVRGEALSCVIIVKLPFASPDDPVLRARLAHLESRGEDPFMTLQLPQAVLALKQGVGRLIRDVDDRGVLMLCDPRVRSRGYGRRFLRSLPEMRQTHDIADVRAFFS